MGKLQELIGKDTVVNIVYETTDYDKFVIVDGNRIIDHVEHIKQSMKEHYVPNAILVNEKFEILDGQNRFKAQKELGKPVRYIVEEGLGIVDARAMNRGAKNWQKKDFIQSYAKEGKEEYVLFKKFMEKYPDFPASVAEIFLRMSAANDSDRRRSSKYQAIQRGVFEIKDYERSCQIADMVMAYKGIGLETHPIYKRKEFVVAIVKLSRLQDFDNDEMVRKIKRAPLYFTPCNSSDDYVRMLEEIYNYRNRKRVRFNV